MTEGSLGSEDDARTLSTRIARACAEKARDTTLDDEKYNLRNVGAACVDRMCVVVTALCNQPKVSLRTLLTSHVTCIAAGATDVGPKLWIICLFSFHYWGFISPRFEAIHKFTKTTFERWSR